MTIVRAIDTNGRQFVAADLQVRCDEQFLALVLKYQGHLRGRVATTQEGRLLLLLRPWPQQQEELPAVLAAARRAAEEAEEIILRLALMYIIVGGAK